MFTLARASVAHSGYLPSLYMSLINWLTNAGNLSSITAWRMEPINRI